MWAANFRKSTNTLLKDATYPQLVALVNAPFKTSGFDNFSQFGQHIQDPDVCNIQVGTLIPKHQLDNLQYRGHICAGMRLDVTESSEPGYCFSQITSTPPENYRLSTGTFNLVNIDKTQLIKMSNSQNIACPEDILSMIRELPSELPFIVEEKNSLLTSVQFKIGCRLDDFVHEKVRKFGPFLSKSTVLLVSEALGTGVLIQDDPACANYDKYKAYKLTPSLTFRNSLLNSQDSYYLNNQFFLNHSTPDFVDEYSLMRDLFVKAGIGPIFFQILSMSDQNPTVTLTEKNKRIMENRIQNSKLWLPEDISYRSSTPIYLEDVNRRFGVTNVDVQIAEGQIISFKLFDIPSGGDEFNN